MQVVGAFNAAAMNLDGETLLLLRVAETVREVPDDEVVVPVVARANGKATVAVRHSKRMHPAWTFPTRAAFSTAAKCFSLHSRTCAWHEAGTRLSFRYRKTARHFPTEDY